MKYFWMLAAAASLAACAGRAEEEVGAAPDEGQTDTTAVVADTSAVAPDTTMGQTETDTSFVQQDTTTMTEPTPGDSALVDDQVPDTTGAIPTDTTPTDTSTGVYTDTTSTTGQDTSSMGAPADSAAQPGQ